MLPLKEYGEKCFARFWAGMWKIDLHNLPCIYRKAAANFSREPENRVQKVLYGALLAGNLILLAGTENSANGIRWLILVIGSK